MLWRASKKSDESAEFFMREIVDGMVESRALLFQNKVSNCDAVPGFLSDAGWLWNERDTQSDGW